jgi:Protein of unknown function (DUF4089)
MARSRKSRPRAKAAPAGKRKTRARKPAAPPKSGKAPPDPLDGFVAAAARALALPVEPQWLPAIRANLEVNLRLAAFVAEFVLPDESEPAPVFRA